MKNFLLSAITTYKILFSGLLHQIFGFSFSGCRFYPTCSEYSHQAIEEFGIIVGVYKSFLRIIRCNPLFQGGFDPIH